ncbi:MAG: hypothetical protein JO153_17150 [Solirubrobacterales bacterium]|nr:hypothetical protein [Solirubrobacterales bacterium]MBV9918231.1 hypothetical protein [Solirubrobacterales bacterium]
MRWGVAVLPLLAALVLAGCGNKPLSSGQLHDRASQVCLLAAEQTAHIAAPHSATGANVFLRRGITVLTPELTQLRRLHPPSEVADVYSASVAAFAKKLSYLNRAAQDLATGGDPASAMQTLEHRLGPVVSQENGGWEALGIPDCLNH